MEIQIINGPNLNLLGVREPGIYGSNSFESYLPQLKAVFPDIEIDYYQSNIEGELIDKLQEAYFDGTDGIVINPGAYTHYSYAIHDALKSLENIIKVEVHISDIKNRESFRANSVTAPACDKQIYGHGLNGYTEAMDYIAENI